MPPLQDSTLHLFDATETRLEVSFHLYIYILNFFFFLNFNNGLGFTGTQGFHLSAIWASFIQCCILQLCHPRYLFITLPYGGHTPFFEHQGFTFMGLITHKRLLLASPPQFCQIGRCHNCLAQQVFFFFFSRPLANHQGSLRVSPL